MSNLPHNLFGGRMIVKPIEKEEEQVGNIVIPKTANASLAEGSVIKIDPAIHEYVKVGDTVIFEEGQGQGQLIDGVPHLWLGINQIWGSFNSSLSAV